MFNLLTGALSDKYFKKQGFRDFVENDLGEVGNVYTEALLGVPFDKLRRGGCDEAMGEPLDSDMWILNFTTGLSDRKRHR